MTDSREARAQAREIKFIISNELGLQIREWARANLEPDPHGGRALRRRVPDHHHLFRHTRPRRVAAPRLVRTSEVSHPALWRRGPRVSRAKAQTAPNGHQAEDPGFRSPTSTNSTRRRRSAGPAPGSVVASRNVPFAPCARLSYRRTARQVSLNGTPARLTLDEQLQALSTTDTAFSENTKLPVLTGSTILELKYRGDLPPLFRQLVEEFGLSLRTVSKYRLSMKGLGRRRRRGRRRRLPGTRGHIRGSIRRAPGWRNR